MKGSKIKAANRTKKKKKKPKPPKKPKVVKVLPAVEPVKVEVLSKTPAQIRKEKREAAVAKKEAAPE